MARVSPWRQMVTGGFFRARTAKPATCHIARSITFSLQYSTIMTMLRLQARPLRRHCLIAVACYTLLLHQHRATAFVCPTKVSFTRRQQSHRTVLDMTLIPLPVEELETLLVTGVPTAAQYSTYWGRSSREKYGALLEASIVTLLGIFMSYFLSFVLGSFVASILGSLCAMWIILSPELRAYQRNWELRGGRELVDPWSVPDDEYEDKQGLYGSLFLGSIENVCVVEQATSVEEYDLSEFQDYTMETDELEKYTGNAYLLRVEMQDTEGRNLQVHSRMSEEYIDLQVGQPILGVLLSTSQKFTSLAALTDFYVPDESCWIGDYPYLDRNEVERLLADDDDLWDALEAQRDDYYAQDEEGEEEDDYYSVEVEDEADDEDSDSYSKIAVRRRNVK